MSVYDEDRTLTLLPNNVFKKQSWKTFAYPATTSPTYSHKDCQRVAILYDNRAGYFFMFGKLFSNSNSDLVLPVINAET